MHVLHIIYGFLAGETLFHFCLQFIKKMVQSHLEYSSRKQYIMSNDIYGKKVFSKTSKGRFAAIRVPRYIFLHLNTEDGVDEEQPYICMFDQPSSERLLQSNKNVPQDGFGISNEV